jgi:hypothetical protein
MNRTPDLNWTPWSDCINYDKNCNYGYKYRHLSCDHHLGLSCEFLRIEIQSCIKVCLNESSYPWSEWTKWSKCSKKNTCYRDRYCYGVGCLGQIDRNQKDERQYATCEFGICQPAEPIINLNYIWQRQGELFANTYFLSYLENNNRNIYSQIDVIMEKVFKKS